MLVQKTKKKTGLSVTNVSKDHWSFGGSKAKSDGTRLVVTILRGKGLLASDILTGKSDPISFIWCGPSKVSTNVGVTNDDFMDVTDEKECINMGIFRTQVCPRTLEPVWNEDIVFPLSITDSYSLSHLRCIIYVRDEDIDESRNGDDIVSYDDLGMCEISVKDILMNGRLGKQSIVLVSKQLDLKSSPRMKKTAEGYIKVTCALVFDQEDTRRMFPEVAEDIRSLGEFLRKFQYQLRERHDKENGLQSLWGSSSSSSLATRRNVPEEGTGDTTGRSTSRSRSARSRPSTLSMQVAPKVCTIARSDFSSTCTGGVRRGEGMIPYLNLRQGHDRNSIAEDDAYLEEICEENEEEEEIHIISSSSSASPSPLYGTDREDQSVSSLYTTKDESHAVRSGVKKRYADEACESKDDMDFSLLIVQHDEICLDDHDEICLDEHDKGQGQGGELVVVEKDEHEEERQGCGGEEKENEGKGQGPRGGDHALPTSPRLEVRVNGGVSSKIQKPSKRAQHTVKDHMIDPNVIVIPPFKQENGSEERKETEGRERVLGGDGRDVQSKTDGDVIVKELSAVQGNATAAARALRDREDTYAGPRGKGRGRGDAHRDVKQQGTRSTLSSTSTSTSTSTKIAPNHRKGGESSPSSLINRRNEGLDMASTSTTVTDITESVGGDKARGVQHESSAVAARRDLKLFKQRRKDEMRRPAVKELELEDGHDEDEEGDEEGVLEVLPPPYASLAVQDRPVTDQWEQREQGGTSSGVSPDPLLNQRVRNCVVPSLDLTKCDRNTLSDTTPATTSAAPSSSSAFGTQNRHSAKERVDDRGMQMKNKEMEKEREINEEKEKEKEKEKEGVQSRSNQSHQRGLGGFTLAPVTIAPKAVYLPSPALSPNLLEPSNEVGGISSPVSTGSHTKPCHVDWSTMKRLFHEGDAVGAFSLVLERGELEDLVRAMEVLGPRPDLLSASLRNRVYDGIATILASSFTAGNRDEVGDTQTEKCLFWILALFRGGSVTGSSGRGSNSSGSGSSNNSSGGGGQSPVTTQQHKSLFLHLPGHTKRDLKEALQQVSQSRSKKGLLAALLLHYFKSNR